MSQSPITRASRADRSLHVTINPDAPDGLVVHSFTSTINDMDAKAYVTRTCGLTPERRQSTPRAVSRPSREDEDAEIARRIEDALKIWGGADDPRDTLVEVYLREHRKLELPDAIAGTVIRFDEHHTNLFWPEAHPCMVARMRNIRTLETVGVHVTRIRGKDASKIKPPKMRGPTGNAAVINQYVSN
jgi:hypothetical protein